MRRNLLAALAALPLALGTAGSVQAQGQQDFTLVNRTGYQINEIYVGPSSSPNWGRDLLGANVLPNGRTFDIRFPGGSRECLWDIKVVYDDGDQSQFMRANLCSISRITLFWNRQAGQTRFVTE
ncbi:hypothetical protein [Falsiroseomonas sp. CW058]|uniref:hypothetical protein n=1 Tax=Falsiroseomonas sp. CW058 TaxID=3388664 RepID=UPI003D312FCA